MNKSNEAPPASVEDQIAAINERLDAGSKRMKGIEEALTTNTEITQDIHDVIVAARVGFRVLGGLGQAVKWVGMVATGALGLWAFLVALKQGGPGPK
jgi:hypothetical protein